MIKIYKDSLFDIKKLRDVEYEMASLSCLICQNNFEEKTYKKIMEE